MGPYRRVDDGESGYGPEQSRWPHSCSGLGHDRQRQRHGPRTEAYQLIRQPGPSVDRTFEIEFLDAGVEAFAFTFG